MIATLMLTATVASLSFVLAAYCAERGLQALGRPIRTPWIIASTASAAVPFAESLVLAIKSPAATDGASFVQLPLTTILTAGAAERFHAAAGSLESWLIGLSLSTSLVMLVRLYTSARVLQRMVRSWIRGEVAGARVWISDNYGPAVIGLRRPEIVIPRRLADLPREEQRLALAHELEHIAARDQWFARAAAVAVIVTPWNPFVWLATRRLRSAIEIDCDARVLRGKPNATAYASLVLNVARWPREAPSSALALGEPTVAQLERRLRLMTTRRQRRQLVPAILLLASAITLAFYGCEAAVSVERPDQRAERLSRDEVQKQPSVVSPATNADNPYFEFQVDKPVTMAPRSASPRYPNVLRMAGVEGEVLAQFVVDAEGRADAATFKALKSSHELFSQSVREALPAMTFVPAEVGGRRVKQVVQQPFAYMIAK